MQDRLLEHKYQSLNRLVQHATFAPMPDAGFLFSRKPGAHQRAAFLRNVSYGLEAGIPLGQALRAAGEASGNPRLAAFARSCSEAVLQGRPLYSVFESSTLFDREYAHVIRVGEASAQLSGTLELCAEAIERKEELSRKVRGAMMYPLIVLALAAGAATLFLTVVIPQVAAMFQQAGVALPLPTRVLLWFSSALRSHGPSAAAAAVCAAGLWGAVVPDDAKRRMASAIRERIPFLGSLHITATSARAARTLSMLLEAGIPALGALRLCAEVAPTPQVQDAWISAEDHLRRGARISEALRGGPLHPLLVQAIAASEVSGNMPQAVSRTATALEREAIHLASTLQTVVEPAFTAGTGVMLGGLLLAMYLPIVNLVNTIR